MKGKRMLIFCLVLLVGISGLFATRIRVTYGDTEYILITSKKITSDDTAYFNGMYDAFACVMEGRSLHEIYDLISTKSFADSAESTTDAAAMKQEYEEAFRDCMDNYSYGTDGNFRDIYPIYRTLMSQPISYSNAEDIVYYGSGRFYPMNI